MATFTTTTGQNPPRLWHWVWTVTFAGVLLCLRGAPGVHADDGDRGLRALTTGAVHACALRPDGTALCWGNNGHGQTDAPPGLHFSTLSAGAYYTCGLRTDGSPLCWGSTEQGQVPGPAGERFVNVFAGYYQACGLRADGSARCWGGNFAGETVVPAAERFTTLAPGLYFTCGLRVDGSVACWGDNYHGESSPPAAERFVSLAAGASQACGLRADGSGTCWGLTYAPFPTGERFTRIAAQMGRWCGLRPDGSATCWGQDSFNSNSVPAGERFATLAVGEHLTCGLRGNGSVACWGYFASEDAAYGMGAIAAGEFHTCGLTVDGMPACWPAGTPVADGAPTIQAKALASGGYHACILGIDGTTHCWGDNDKGQTDVPTGQSFVQLAGGFWHTCGVTTEGNAQCWGWNANGQASAPPGSFQQVSAGFVHSCGVLTDGTGLCWGYNGDGETDVPSGMTFRAIGAGDHHSCGLRSDGGITCWGDNTDGQIDAPAGQFASLAVSSFHNCAIRDDGTLACWGDDGLGQASPPTGRYIAITTGYQHSCAVREDGARVCWGDVSASQYPSLTLQPEELLPGETDTAYIEAFLLESTTPGYEVGAAVFSVVSGALPPGLTLASDGGLTGTPTDPGEYAFAIEGRDAGGFTAQRAYALTITGTDRSPPVIVPDISGTEGSNGWYVGNVSIGWSATDPGSTISSSTGCNTVVLTTDTIGADFTCTATSAGGTSTRTVSVKRDATPPDTSLASAPPATSTTRDAHFEFEGSDALSGVARFTCVLDGGEPNTECTSPLDLGDLGDGAHALTVYAVDAAGNPDPSPATHAWTVQTDATPPVIVPDISGTQGSNGWYTGDVTLTWSVTDPESEISSAVGCTTSVLQADNIAAGFTCTATSAGGTAQETVTIHRDGSAPETVLDSAPANPSAPGDAVFVFSGSDEVSGIDGFECRIDGGSYAACASPHTIAGLANGTHSFAVRARNSAGLVDASPAGQTWTIQADATAPVANPTLSRQPNANGWLNANVTITWNWSDTGSGLNNAQCTDRTTTSAEGVQTISATCSDAAGNVGSASVLVRVDKTAPTLTPSISPNRILLNGSASVSPGGSDSVSYVASESCGALATATIGAKSIACTVVDAAGNSTSGKANYAVIYGFNGFASPVLNLPGLNLMRVIGTAPLRWQVVDANGAPVTTLKAATVTSTLIACPGVTPQRVSVFAASTKLTNLGGGNYELGWKPAKTDVGKCRRLNLALGDGEPHAVQFQFDP